MQIRRNFIRQFLAATVLSIALPAMAQTLDKDYTLVTPPQPTENPAKIEVLEFFSYGCPHCNDFHPAVTAWAAKQAGDVQFRRVPVSFGRAAWANLGRLFYALEASGDLEKFDGQVFHAIHAERINLFEDKGMIDWLGKKGVDTKKFSDALGSFGVMSKMKRADQMASSYRIQGVPTLVINGKYMVTGKEHSEMLAITDKLIAKIRAERGKK